MKSINFISPVPPKKQQAFTLWAYFSFVILSLLIMALALLYVRHFNVRAEIAGDLEEIKKTTASFETLVAQKKQLQQEKESLEQRLHYVNTNTNNAHDIQTLLTSLAHMTPPALCLITVHGAVGGTITFEGITHTTQAVTSFLHLLNNCPSLRDVTLLSLTPTEEKSPDGKNLMHFCLRGEWHGSH